MRRWIYVAVNNRTYLCLHIDCLKQQDPLSATLHGVISQNAVIFIVCCVSNSNLTSVTSTVPSRTGETWDRREVSNTELQSLNCLYRWGRTTPETHGYRRNFCVALSFHFLAPGLKEDISNYGRWRGRGIELQGLAWKMEVLVPSPGFSGGHIDGQGFRCCRNADGRWVHGEACIAERLKLLEYTVISFWSIYNTFFLSSTVHLDTIESFIYPTDAQIDCSKNVKIYITIYMRGAATCFGFSQPSSGS